MNNVSGVGSSGLSSSNTCHLEGNSDNAQVKGGDLISSLPSDVFGEGICAFLEPKDLCACIETCRVWKERFQCDKTWENLCQIAFGANGLPARNGSVISYKEVFQRLHNRFFGQLFYERYIGSVGQVPPIPPHLSPFVLLKEPDPCDPTKTKGQTYVWMYVPSHFDVQVEVDGKVKTEKKPVTIKTLPELFAKPKEGHPSKYGYIGDKIAGQDGDTEHLGGWICMRRGVVDKGRSWADQKKNASRNQVVIPRLLPRILLNFLVNVRSGAYLDGQNPWTLARTAAKETGSSCPLACGYGGSSGLSLRDILFEDGDVGVAVALPFKEVQDTHP